jgi:hypothetical protein
MRFSILCAVAVGLPLAAQQSYDLSGEHVAIYNLAGTHTLTAGSGNAVRVEVRTHGGDAGRLTVDRGNIDGRQTLVVRYPGNRIVYRHDRNYNFNTTLTVRGDGTFSDGDWDRGRRERGDRVEVRSSGDGLEAWAELRIAVPNGQRLSLYNGAGTITVTNVDGTLRLDGGATEVTTTGTRGTLSIDLGSGNANVTNAQGDVDVDTGSGSVTVNGVTGGLFNVDTGSGSVEADAVTVDRVNIDTGSGSVRLRGAAAQTILVDTGSGSVTLELTRRPRDVTVDTGSGGVTLIVPSDYGATVNIETGSGGIDIDFPIQMRRWSRDRVTGTIGDGNGRLTVETGSGGVRVRAGTN